MREATEPPQHGKAGRSTRAVSPAAPNLTTNNIAEIPRSKLTVGWWGGWCSYLEPELTGRESNINLTAAASISMMAFATITPSLSPSEPPDRGLMGGI
jgi:hypothetical protein